GLGDGEVLAVAAGGVVAVVGEAGRRLDRKSVVQGRSRGDVDRAADAHIVNVRRTAAAVAAVAHPAGRGAVRAAVVGHAAAGELAAQRRRGRGAGLGDGEVLAVAAGGVVAVVGEAGRR